jgi:hypothetical protein
MSAENIDLVFCAGQFHINIWLNRVNLFVNRNLSRTQGLPNGQCICDNGLFFTAIINTNQMLTRNLSISKRNHWSCNRNQHS